MQSNHWSLEVKLIGAITIQRPCFVMLREPGIFNRGEERTVMMWYNMESTIWILHLIHRRNISSICCVLAEGTLKTLYLKNSNLIGLVSAVGIHHFVQHCNVGSACNTRVKCVICVSLHISDLTESVIPRWMFETGAVFLHGYDKEGNKLCAFTLLTAQI